MAAKSLTETFCRQVKQGTSNRRYGDTTRNLKFEVTRGGSKVFLFHFTSPEVSKRRFFVIGHYPTTSLADARAAIPGLQDQVRQGIDPIEEDKRQKAAEAAEKAAQDQEDSLGTVRQLFAAYVQDLRLDGKRSAKQIENALNRNCTRILDMKARDVTREHIADIISEVFEHAPQQSRHVRNYMQTAFNFGLDYRTRPRWRRKWQKGEVADFQLNHNPVALTKVPAAINVRKRFLSKEELKTLWHSMGVEAMSADLALCIKLLLATGQRVEEVLHAKWSEFDLHDMLWVIPAERRKTRHKNPVDHVVPLTDLHKQLLDELQEITGESEWLFPHRDGERPRGADSLSQAVHRFCVPGKQSTRKGFEKFLAKDCRRTFKTLAGSINISLEMRNRLQGHALTDIGSRHYDQWEYLDEKRAAMVKWCRWLDELVYGKAAAKVVKLPVGA